MYVQLAYTYIPCCQYISICVHVCICVCSVYISVSVYVWTYICICFYRSEFIRPLLSILFRNDLYSKYQVCLYVYVLYVVNCGCADCVKLQACPCPVHTRAGLYMLINIVIHNIIQQQYDYFEVQDIIWLINDQR